MRALLILLFSLGISAQKTNQFDVNGERHGLWKGYHEKSNRLRYEGTFEHGKETGVFKYYDDTKAGTVIATRNFSIGNGSCYTIFYDQKKNKVSEGELVNKKPEGVWKYYHYQSDKIMTIENYINGQLNGEKQVYYQNGQLAEKINYINDLKDGEYHRYAETGTSIEESEYKNGELHGKVTYYDKEGKVLIKGEFKKDFKVGMWETYENGKLKKRETAKEFAEKSFKKSNPNKLEYNEARDSKKQ